MNNGDVAEKPDEHIFGTQIADGHGFRGLFEETTAIGE